MNSAQKVILTAGALVLLAMLLFPPYTVLYRSEIVSPLGGGTEKATVFRPAWSAPERVDPDEGELNGNLPSGQVLEAEINIGMLGIELLAASIATWLALLVAGSNRRRPPIRNPRPA